MTEQKVVICPYCGDAQVLAERCRACGGLFEPLSRQATHNAMGPWFVRDPDRPFQPGCSYETLLRLVERRRVTDFTIVRGPTTRQFWTIAKRVPGLSHLLGCCHQCDASVDAGDHACHACGAAFGSYMDRNYLGLPEIRPLPWEAEGQEQLRPSVRQQTPMWRSAADSNEPRTISSFVSDDELLGSGDGDEGRLPESFGGNAAVPSQEQVATMADQAEPAPAPAPAPAPLAAPATASPAPAPAPAPAASPAPGGRVELALRRRVADQQRRIRALMIVAAVLAALAVTFALAWTSAGSNAAVSPADRSGESNPAAPVEPAADPVVDLMGEYQRAIGLMDAAADEQLGVSERIDSYEEAHDLLMMVQSQLPPQDRPAELEQRIEQTREQLDRLRLREFFP